MLKSILVLCSIIHGAMKSLTHHGRRGGASLTHRWSAEWALHIGGPQSGPVLNMRVVNNIAASFVC